MNVKEYLQFLIMMIPTFLLLGALALSLAFPAGTAGAPATEIAVVQPEMAEDVAE
jgi:F0F1-type ATP synthase membrane subunit c/vacuolar-type H+-ATPase subunit K